MGIIQRLVRAGRAAAAELFGSKPSMSCDPLENDDDWCRPSPRDPSGHPPPVREVGYPLQRWIDSGQIDMRLIEEADQASGGMRQGLPSLYGDPEEAPWDRVLLGFWSHPNIDGMSFVLNKGDVLVDELGAEHARVAEGPVRLVLGGQSFVTVKWSFSDQAMAAQTPQPRLRLQGSPWISTRREGEDEQSFLQALLNQIEFDERRGYLRPEYAKLLRHVADERAVDIFQTVIGRATQGPRPAGDPVDDEDHFGRKP